MAQYPSNTFGAELTTLAVRVGLAAQTSEGPELPSEPTLSQLKVAYLDAVDTFANDRSWSWLAPIVTIETAADGLGPKNVNADPCLYAIGNRFRGQPFNVKSSIRRSVHVGSPSEVRQNIAMGLNTGYATMIACEERAVGGDKNQSQVQTVLMVYPTPSTAETLTFQMKLRSYKPVDLTDELAWGEEHNQTVRRIAMVNLAANGQINGVITDLQAWADAELSRSRRIDGEAHGDGVVLGSPVFANSGYSPYVTWNEPLA